MKHAGRRRQPKLVKVLLTETGWGDSEVTCLNAVKNGPFKLPTDVCRYARVWVLGRCCHTAASRSMDPSSGRAATSTAGFPKWLIYRFGQALAHRGEGSVRNCGSSAKLKYFLLRSRGFRLYTVTIWCTCSIPTHLTATRPAIKPTNFNAGFFP